MTGALAEITATRTFHHPGPDPIDAELWFAVPPAAAVDRVVVTIGDRVITSRVEAIEDARRVYLAAANAGRTATLLELADDDLVVQHLANLQPGDDVTVELHLVQTAARRDGTWELVLPLTVAPRLQDPADPGPTYVVTGPDADPRSAPEVERVNARFAVHAGHWVNWIDAPSHPHRSTLDGADATLVVDQAPANRDLVVRWSTATQDPSTAVWVAGTHAVLLLEAPAPWARYSRPPRDVVLLIDASDTMVGRWPAVVEVVRAVLTGVRPDDHLTVLVFADSVRGLALRELGTVDAVRRVTDRLHTLPLGGATNLPLAMSFAEALPIPDGGPRTVVVVSDGGGERVSPPGPGVTVHTIGVGAATHRALLDRLARDGGGLSVTVTPEDDPGQVVQPIVDALPGPVLDGVTLSWASTAPRTVPPLYPGQVVTVAAEGVTCGRVVVEGSYLGHPFTTFATPRCEEHSRAVEVTWARLAVEARADRPDEARAVALEFGIASPYTSFVGVDDVVRGSPATGSDTVALAPPVDVASRHAIVLGEETLQRVPGGTRPAAGNAWFDLLPTRPSALAAAAGWTGTRPTVTG
ncbi:MAG: VIT domain-containing protein, partial [Myxococcota bacterium]